MAAPQPEAAAKAADRAATVAADIASARVAARLSGKRVEALSERTESSTTWANKDGSLTSEFAAGPIRFKDATGEWRDVDVNLTSASDGSVISKAHPQGLRLSGRSDRSPSTNCRTRRRGSTRANGLRSGPSDP
ncbi:hypothetical protein GCM10010347_63700 [Streptomyces cirratus]|uniref:Uncharacterized protein n=1 Tax=Streptomyces cirratus TaxID=68187 RepID=A0ABQ3F250_9ACTN|nr:hypothetical protein GCM10010347_63700 [Streptomyces cirratus]